MCFSGNREKWAPARCGCIRVCGDEFLRRALEIFMESKINIVKCIKGLDHLAGSRLRKDKTTDYVFFGELVKNGHQHAVDALGYVGMSLDNRIAQTSVLVPDLGINEVKCVKYGTKTAFKY